jgi:hypothetical protein
VISQKLEYSEGDSASVPLRSAEIRTSRNGGETWGTPVLLWSHPL